MLETGAVLQGRYRIEQFLGRGGMGEVYLATELQLHKRVAVKCMMVRLKDPEERQKAFDLFQNEARILASLDHPGLVEVSHYFHDEHHQYLVMSYVDGKTLEALWKESDTYLPVLTVLEWMDQVTEVLDYLHSREPPVLFRDLKPANVMLDSRNRIRLVDFGIARCFDHRETAAFLKGAGTPGYAPLEQFGGTTDPRADIYAAGATLWTLLTRAVPAFSFDRELEITVLSAPSALNPNVPPELDEVVLKMMAQDKDERYASVAEVREALREVRHDSRAGAAPPSPPPAPTPTLGLPTPPTLVPTVTSHPKVLASPTMDCTRPVETGTVLEGKYVIDYVLSEGLYRGHRQRAPQTGLMLRLLPRPYTDAWLAEARRLAALSHPNLVAIHDSFVMTNGVCLVTDYVDGFSLSRLLARKDPLPVPLALQVAYQLVDVLGFLHDQALPVVVGTLEPDDFTVTAGGQCMLLLPVLTVWPPRQAVTGFTPPEATPGTAAADQYALGSIIYSLFTRQIPPPALDLASGKAFLASPELLNPSVPPRLRGLVSKLMATEPHERYPSMADVRTALDWVFESTRRQAAAVVSPAPEPEPEPEPEPPPPPPALPPAPVAVEPPLAPAPVAEAPPVRRPLSNRVPTVTKAPAAAPPLARPSGRTLPASLSQQPPRDNARRVALTGTPEAAGGHRNLRVEAQIAPPPGLLVKARLSSPTQYQTVRVAEADVRSITFESIKTFRLPVTLPIRLSVTYGQETSRFDAEVEVTEGSPVSHECWQYKGQFRNMPADLRTLLAAEKVKERRRSRRVREYFQVFTPMVEGHRALGLDISATGLGMLTSSPLEAGQCLDLDVDLNAGDGATGWRVQVQATVAHCLPKDDGRFEIGMQFDALTEDGHRILKRYLNSRV